MNMEKIKQKIPGEEISTSDEEMLLNSPEKLKTSTPNQTINKDAHNLDSAAKKFAERTKHGASFGLIRESKLSSTLFSGADVSQMGTPNTNKSIGVTDGVKRKPGSAVTINSFIETALTNNINVGANDDSTTKTVVSNKPNSKPSSTLTASACTSGTAKNSAMANLDTTKKPVVKKLTHQNAVTKPAMQNSDGADKPSTLKNAQSGLPDSMHDVDDKTTKKNARVEVAKSIRHIWKDVR